VETKTDEVILMRGKRVDEEARSEDKKKEVNEN